MFTISTNEDLGLEIGLIVIYLVSCDFIIGNTRFKIFSLGKMSFIAVCSIILFL